MIDLSQLPLKEIVKNYFSKRYFFEELQNRSIGKSGQKWNFDGIVKIAGEGVDDSQFGVFIKDWNRSIGVNQVRLLEKACIDMEFDGGLIVGNNFSSHAKTYGRSKGVQIVSRSELVFKLEYS